MARKQAIASITGVSNGAGNHAHGVLVELPAEVTDATLHNVQITITGGADGKKRHASALVSLEDLLAALCNANLVIHGGAK